MEMTIRVSRVDDDLCSLADKPLARPPEMIKFDGMTLQSGSSRASRRAVGPTPRPLTRSRACRPNPTIPATDLRISAFQRSQRGRARPGCINLARLEIAPGEIGGTPEHETRSTEGSISMNSSRHVSVTLEIVEQRLHRHPGCAKHQGSPQDRRVGVDRTTLLDDHRRQFPSVSWAGRRATGPASTHLILPGRSPRSVAGRSTWRRSLRPARRRS